MDLQIDLSCVAEGERPRKITNRDTVCKYFDTWRVIAVVVSIERYDQTT